MDNVLKERDLESKRLKWLDGLKGLACMGVFTHHFMLGLFPSSYYGEDAMPKLSGALDYYLSFSPFSVVINGNFWVHLFILISAFLPAFKLMQAKEEDLRSKAGTTLLRRYPRLALPIFVFSMGNYCILRLLMHFDMNYSGKELNYGLADYIRHALFYQFFAQDDTILGPLWTIHYLFFAVIFAVLLSLLAKKSFRFMPALLLLLVIPVGSADWNYLPVLLGVLLADICAHGRLLWLKDRFKFLERRGAKIAVSVLLILFGLFLGGYPSYVTPHNIYEIFITLGPIWKVLGILNTAAFLHALGAFLVMGGLMIWNEEKLPSPLSGKPMQFLGSCCMGIFLLHLPWLEYLGYYLNKEILYPKTGSWGYAALILYPIMAVLVLFTAWLFHILVEKPCDKLCSKIKV